MKMGGYKVESIGFAIPIDFARKVVDQLKTVGRIRR